MRENDDTHDGDTGEKALLVLLDEAESHLVERIELACAAAEPEPVRRLEAGLRAALGWVDESPAEARASLPGMVLLSDRAAARRDAILERLAAILRANAPTPQPNRPLFEVLVVGALAEATARRLLFGEGDRMVAFTPQLLNLLLGSYPDEDGRADD